MGQRKKNNSYTNSVKMFMPIFLLLSLGHLLDGAVIKTKFSGKSILTPSSVNGGLTDRSPGCEQKIAELMREMEEEPPIDGSYQALMELNWGRMTDSWGKIPSGLQNLWHTLKVPGDKEECLGISTPIYGKYCTVSLTSKTLNKEIELGACMPDLCTREDIGDEVDAYMGMLFQDYGEFSINATQLAGMKCERSGISMCMTDVARLLPQEPQEWLDPSQWLHNKIIDSWGKLHAGLAKGNTEWPGSKSECLGVGDFTEYCQVPTKVRVGRDPKVKKDGVFGICIPKSCHSYPMEFMKVIRKHLKMVKFHIDFDFDESGIKCGRE